MAAVKAYRYSAEIAQMCYVFGQPCEPDEEVVQTIEDIVRAQLAEIVRVPAAAPLTARCCKRARSRPAATRAISRRRTCCSSCGTTAPR